MARRGGDDTPICPSHSLSYSADLKLLGKSILVAAKQFELFFSCQPHTGSEPYPRTHGPIAILDPAKAGRISS